MTTKPIICVDCLADGITTARPTPHGGPRSPLCTTHWRKRRKRASARAHATRTEKVYGVTAEQYQALYDGQGGRCAICRRANGTTKRLAVDHDHATGEVRGLLCGPDNQLLGRLGVEGLARAIDYLRDPPARRIL